MYFWKKNGEKPVILSKSLIAKEEERVTALES